MRTNRNRIEIRGDRVLRYPLTARDRADLPGIAARHEAAAASGLPVPRVLALHEDHLELERMSGVPLLQCDLSPCAALSLGAQLSELLGILRESQGWADPSISWPDLWQALAAEAPGPQTEAAARLAREVRIAPVHGDLSGGNLLVDADGTLRGVLDWDGATIADPAQDFTALCANVPVSVAEAVRAGTAQAEEFERRAAVYLATWPAQNELWLQGRHPWLRGVVPEGTR